MYNIKFKDNDFSFHGDDNGAQNLSFFANIDRNHVMVTPN